MSHPKIFGIGFHKTGTSSLGAALKQLGLRVTGPNGLRNSHIAQEVYQIAFSLVDKYDAFQDNPMVYARLPDKYASFCQFTFVRNPFDRLVSCYRNKVAQLRHDERLRYGKFSGSGAISSDVSFEEFVAIVCRVPDYLANHHFRSQVATVGKKRPEFIGRFEKLSADWEQLAKQYDFPTALCHANSSKNLAGFSADYRTYYTPDLAANVYRRYKKDFKTFGYGKQIF